MLHARLFIRRLIPTKNCKSFCCVEFYISRKKLRFSPVILFFFLNYDREKRQWIGWVLLLF